MQHGVDDVEVSPRDHLLPQLPTVLPVGRRQAVRLDVHEVRPLQVQLVRHPGAVVVPVELPVVVPVRVVPQAQEHCIRPRHDDPSDELRRLLLAQRDVILAQGIHRAQHDDVVVEVDSSVFHEYLLEAYTRV